MSSQTGRGGDGAGTYPRVNKCCLVPGLQCRNIKVSSRASIDPMTGTAIALPNIRLQVMSFIVTPAALAMSLGKPCSIARSCDLSGRSTDNVPVPSPSAKTCILGPDAVRHSQTFSCLAPAPHSVRPVHDLDTSTKANSPTLFVSRIDTAYIDLNPAMFARWIGV